MLTFLSADLITGEIRDELPLLVGGDLSRFIGQPGDGSLALPVRDPATPADWLDHTQPWRTLLAAVDVRGRVVWAGIPKHRRRDPLEPVVHVDCRTVEGYFGRRYVPDRSWQAADQTSAIARGLAQVAGGANGVGLEYDTPDSGVLRAREYLDAENATVLDRLTELARVINGFEWTVDVEWSSPAQTRLAKVFRTGYPNIGRVTNSPNAVFELPGGIVAAQYDESWGEDDAATHVTAIGEGESDQITVSAPVVDTVREGAGWPRLETRQTFQSVTRQETIDAHAEAVAGVMFGGQQLLQVQQRIDQPPVFGDEWNLGDSVRVQVATDSVTLDEVWRVAGWYVRDSENEVEPVIARMPD